MIHPIVPVQSAWNVTQKKRDIRIIEMKGIQGDMEGIGHDLRLSDAEGSLEKEVQLFRQMGFAHGKVRCGISFTHRNSMINDSCR